MNHLFYGDNLKVLRESVKDESVDLVYLDPPFNSKRDYNLLFRNSEGKTSPAQITAFEDTWHWGPEAELEYDQILRSGHGDICELIRSLRSFLGENDMMAYLVMMANRLIELHRVLKSTGSLYLHCDPSASHYLKVVLDGIFGPQMFKNEIIWRRTGSHNSAKRFGPIHDVLLFYTKSKSYYFKKVKRPYMKAHVEKRYSADSAGNLKFTSGGNILTGSGVRTGESGSVWKGFDPTEKHRHWAIPGFLAEEMDDDFEDLSILQKLDALYEAGLIEITEGNAYPTPVRFLRPEDGLPLQDLWTYQPYTEGLLYGMEGGIDSDTKWLGTTDPERLGYPTQKPIGLLARVIQSSCPENGVVLDPFCGCGTAVHTAQKLGRNWIGIDITHLAISLIEKRLKDGFPGISFQVHGTPTDLDGAKDLAKRDPYQFQWWACSLVDSLPFHGKKKGADGGIDGIIYFSDMVSGKKVDQKVIVSVKGGDHVNVSMIRDLKGVMWPAPEICTT